MKSSDTASFETYFRPPKEGYRSINIKLDYGDPQIVGSYLPTQKSLGVLEAIFESFNEESRQRASVIIAPYGSGKSSLLLFLCALLEVHRRGKSSLGEVQVNRGGLTTGVARAIKHHLSGSRGYLPVVLLGDEGSLESAFCAGLKESLEQHGLSKGWKKIVSILENRKSKANSSISPSAVDLFRRAARYLCDLGYKGIVIVYDEFGKVLESQQVNPRPADLFFLQTFAEVCSRSGKYQIHLILSMHQGFSQYAHRLPIYMRNEWTKIEGRFRTFHFVEDSIQVYELIAQAIKRLHTPRMKSLLSRVAQEVKPYVREAQATAAFSAFESAKELKRILQEVYPLNPVALFVLPRLSARVAQNERTLFHFLLGQEPGCLCPVLQERSGTTPLPFLQISDLFSYFADLMIRDTGVGGTYRRYIEINSALERVGAKDEFGQEVIKTIGILSIINEPDKLPPTEQVLRLALGAFNNREQLRLKSTLEHLVRNKVLLHRRHTGEYRIWEGSDVDLLGLLRHKKAEYEIHFDPVAFLSSKLPAPAILANRYNEEFGLIRYFEGTFSSVEKLRSLRWEQTFEDFRQIDGRIYYLFAESKAEIEEAIHLTQEIHEYSQVLFAVPQTPLNLFEPLLELYCLEQLLGDSAFVSQDPVLQRELAELADDCFATVQQKVHRLCEPRYGETIWIYQGKIQQEITNQASLRRLVSSICREVFQSTPRFNNELINRRRPSAVIVNARKKLLRAILENTGTENLGLTGFGPDVSIFRAIIRNTGLYQSLQPANYRFVSSEQIKDENLKATLKAIEDYLHNSTHHPRSFSKLIDQLFSPPFGLRAGVIPVLLSAVFQAFPVPLNVLEDDVFVKELKAETFERMLFSPGKVTVQCVRLPDEVSTYLAKISQLFGVESAQAKSSDSQRQQLRFALEAIYRWVHQLPSCVMTTQLLTPFAASLRTTLVKATDPVALVLDEIPQLYLGKPETGKAGTVRTLSEAERITVLEDLKKSIHEIDSYKAGLATGTATILRKVFSRSFVAQQENLTDGLRSWVGTLEGNVKQYLQDPQCSGFITRVMSNYETDETLVESLASLVTGRSISYWDDNFLHQFELGLLAIQKKIVETDSLLKTRGSGGIIRRDPLSWTVRIERGGQPTEELVIAALDASQDVMAVKSRVEQVLYETKNQLKPEERRRVLLELLTGC